MSGQGVLAIIPARSGSKSLLDKNIRMIAGKPLLAWSIEHALACRHITRIVVSTDSERYARLAREHGAETPFLRPPELAGDTTPDVEVFLHALHWLEENEDYCPELCVHLRPTAPVRDPDDIDSMIQFLREHSEFSSARTISTLGKEVICDLNVGELMRLLPTQHGQAARNVAAVCREVLDAQRTRPPCLATAAAV